MGVEAPVKRGPGRPKGSKNKSPRKKAVRKAGVRKAAAKKVTKFKKKKPPSLAKSLKRTRRKSRWLPKEEYKKKKAAEPWKPSIYPTEFATLVLKMQLYEWQMEILEAVAMGFPVSFAAANGSGKTSFVVCASILWFLNEFPKGWVVITSGSARQLEKQLMPALRVHKHRFPKWRFLNMGIITDQGGEAVLFSTDDPGRAEGWHPKISNTIDPVFVIVDEAKTVPDAVFQAFDRCTRRFQLYVSTPGAAAGQFYRSHRNEKQLFFTRQITSWECPHIDPKKRERDLKKYGKDDPLYKSMHLAEFDEDDESLVLSPGALNAALQDQPDAQVDSQGKPIGETVAYCDFAAGGDENVLAVRRGNCVRIVKAWRQVNTVQAVREFIHLFKHNGLKPGMVYGDNGGMGVAMIDLFEEEGFRVIRVNNGAPAIEPDNYSNVGSEMWFIGRREIVNGRINLSDSDTIDPVLFQQLTTRPRDRDAKNRLRAMPKDKMASEFSLPSPDRADALLGAIYCGPHITGAITFHVAQNSVVPRSNFSVPAVRF